MRGKFACMRKLSLLLRRVFRGRPHYLLMDGMHSCVYIPKQTYRKLNKTLLKYLECYPGAENSLRFLWTKCGGNWLLVVNPDKKLVDMNCTHGLTRDSKGRVIIPCPYMQRILHESGLPPEWCGKLDVEFVSRKIASMTQMMIIKRQKL